MVKRILLAAILALIAPVPTAWVFYQYGEWLFTRFQDIGFPEYGAGFLTFFSMVILGMILIAGIAVMGSSYEKQITCWFKTGRFHA